MLQAAAVIGKDVPLPLLGAIAENPQDDLLQRLARLRRAEFLYETRLFPEVEYTFKHALTHEVAYGSLLGSRKRELHAGIVHAIERLYAGRISEHLAPLAHHALQAELWSSAAVYAQRAGEQAMGRAANREAVVFLDQALFASRHLPEQADTLAQVIDLHFLLRDALWPLGQFEMVLRHL